MVVHSGADSSYRLFRLRLSPSRRKGERVLRVERIELRELADGPELSGLIHGLPGESEPFRAWFRFPGLAAEQVALSGNPFVPALLPVAMWLGKPIEIDAPVSPELMRGVRQVMNIWHGWMRRLRPIEIHAPADSDLPAAGGRGTACFFTAGVDSFYTLLRNLATETGSSRVTHLLFLGGLPDTPLENEARFRARCASTGEIARELGLETVFGLTNVAAMLPGLTTSWGIRAASSAVACGLCLSPLFRRELLSTSFTYDTMHHWGCHLLTDPLWSTGQVRFEHHGCERSRAEKLDFLVRNSPLALRNLCVCGGGGADGGNCGRCEKCFRTMTALRALGALDRCHTLPHKLPLDAVRRLNAMHFITRFFLQENLQALRRMGTDPELERALSETLRWRPLAALRFHLVQAAYRLDRDFLAGRARHWALRRAQSSGTRVQLFENPVSWLVSQLRRGQKGGSQAPIG